MARSARARGVLCANVNVIKTRLTQLLSIKHPILLAPMAGVAGGKLANAVSGAGGFGIVGGGYGEREFLHRELSLVDNSRPFGVGLITWRLDREPALLDEVLQYNPNAILLSFGDPGPYVDKIKSNNVMLFAQCQNLTDAKSAAACGADVIIAQGTEAGGHGSQRASMSLIPAVVDALPDHVVIGAGGIGDGRGLAACLSLGASGAMLGSRFYASEESLAPSEAKQKTTVATGDQTTRSSVFDVLREYHWPKPYNLRTIRNSILDKYEHNMPALLSNKTQEIIAFNRARAENNFDYVPVIVGEAVDLISDLPSAAAVLERLVKEAEQTIHATERLLHS